MVVQSVLYVVISLCPFTSSLITNEVIKRGICIVMKNVYFELVLCTLDSVLLTLLTCQLKTSITDYFLIVSRSQANMNK